MLFESLKIFLPKKPPIILLVKIKFSVAFIDFILQFEMINPFVALPTNPKSRNFLFLNEKEKNYFTSANRVRTQIHVQIFYWRIDYYCQRGWKSDHSLNTNWFQRIIKFFFFTSNIVAWCCQSKMSGSRIRYNQMNIVYCCICWASNQSPKIGRSWRNIQIFDPQVPDDHIVCWWK